MQSYRLTRPRPVESRPLTLERGEAPVPGEGELLVRVKTCGICRTDLHVVEGELPVRRSSVTPGHQIIGEVAGIGEGVRGWSLGDRAGIAWLHRACGVCEYCARDLENLCERPEFTGWTVDGGFAEQVVASADFVYRIPESFDDRQAAPLLCAGIIGYRALRLSGIDAWTGARLGLYGFGAAGHVAIQIAIARGAEVFVCTRDRQRHQALAKELGAAWVGGADEPPPRALDASILFAPAGELVPVALQAIRPGGTLVLGGIHMSPIPSMDYELLYRERCLRSVANNTRADGRAFLAEAALVPVRTHVETFAFDRANEALMALKNDAIKGAGVLVIDS